MPVATRPSVPAISSMLLYGMSVIISTSPAFNFIILELSSVMVSNLIVFVFGASPWKYSLAVNVIWSSNTQSLTA